MAVLSLTQTNVVQWVPVAKDVASTVESLATIFALVVAACWTYRLFIKKREGFPKASPSQTVSFWSLPSGNRLIRVALTVKNEGDVLLEIPEGFTYLQQIRPWPEDVLQKEYSTLEIAWPLIVERKIETGFHIEPKESETILMDFIINDEFKEILVYSYLKNVTKPKIGWTTSTTINFESEESDKKQNPNMNNEKEPVIKRQSEAKPRPQPTQQPIRRTMEQGPTKDRSNTGGFSIRKGSK